MAAKMEFSIVIKDEEGNEVIRKLGEKDIPGMKDFDRLGFRQGFHQLETAMLEFRKEISDSTTETYLEALSQKKQKKQP